MSRAVLREALTASAIAFRAAVARDDTIRYSCAVSAGRYLRATP